MGSAAEHLLEFPQIQAATRRPQQRIGQINLLQNPAEVSHERAD